MASSKVFEHSSPMERVKRRAILPALRAGHHRWRRGLAAHAHQGDALRPAGDGLGVGQRVGRVGVAGPGRGQHVLPVAGHRGHRLPRRAVALETRDERGVDHVVLEGPDQEGGDEAPVLADALHVGVGRPGQHRPAGDARDLLVRAGPAEEVGLDVGLPGPEAGAGPGAQGAALQAVGAVVGAAVGVHVEGLVDALGVVVAEDVVGAGDHARGAPGAESGGDDLGEQLGPLRLLGWHRPTIFGRTASGPIPCAGARDPRSRALPGARRAGPGPADRPGLDGGLPLRPWRHHAAAAAGGPGRPLLHRGAPARASSCCSTPTGGPTLGLRFGMTGGLVVDGQQALDRLRYGPGRLRREVGARPRRLRRRRQACCCTTPAASGRSSSRPTRSGSGPTR